VPARQGPTTPQDSSRQLQRRLDLAAKRSRTRRVHARSDRIVRPDMRWRAWQEGRANGGAAGIAGVTIAAVERHGGEQVVEHSRQDLRARPYRPPPVRRVHSPKPDGGQRPVGMPTVRERVVQQAGTLVIAPICEAHFQDTSDGVRPQRRAHQAVKAGKPALIRGGWVVDADLHPDCDTIDHTLRLRLVARRISARRGLKLLRQGLNGGVVEQGQWQPTEVGAPHGGVGTLPTKLQKMS
jgi:RNA-directed DNA polymerase